MSLIPHLHRQIAANNGWIDFASFMHQALYHPQWGYYASGRAGFGAGGDFVTAPALGSLFAECLALPIKHWIAELGEPALLEFGAGDGRLAEALLSALEPAAPPYLIVEPSPALRERQRRRLERFAGRVEWHSAPPEDAGPQILLANEVLDALPVRRFVIGEDGQAYELGVAVADGRFAWAPADAPLEAECQARLAPYQLPAGFISELPGVTTRWLADIAPGLNPGALLLIDYGYAEPVYYHPERTGGTLRCHYRHRAHADPFLNPGLQDITAHVNFSALAAQAESSGLELLGFSTQGRFLLDCGALDILERRLARPLSAMERRRRVDELRELTEPQAMGEIFKVMALGRGVGTPPGFNHPARL